MDKNRRVAGRFGDPRTVGELWETHITRYDRLSLVNEHPTHYH